MLNHNTADVEDVDCMDAPEDFDSANITFDPFVV
jgi:hypothetical protein